jgi:hypothetical protein
MQVCLSRRKRAAASPDCATGDYPVDERRLSWRTTIMQRGWQKQQPRMMTSS